MDVRKTAALHIATIFFFVLGILAVLACSGCKHIESTEKNTDQQHDENETLFDTVLVVFNKNSQQSRLAAGEYLEQHNIPVTNICSLDINGTENISLIEFEEKVRKPIQDSLDRAGRNKIAQIILCDDLPREVVGKQEENLSEFDDMVATVWNNYPGLSYYRIKELQNPEADQFTNVARQFPHYSVRRLIRQNSTL